MKTLLLCGVALVVAAIGYVAGFRQGWYAGLVADSLPRGVISMKQLKLLGRDRAGEVKYAMEIDVDSALLQWHELSQSGLRPIVNLASGEDVFPGFEKYVRPLAAYRKSTPSPVPESEYAKLYPVPTEVARQTVARVVEEYAR